MRRCRLQNNHGAFRCGATAFGWPNHFFTANKLATPWIFRVSLRSPPKDFKTEFIVECAHSRLRGFCIAQSLSTYLMALFPIEFPTPRGFIAGTKFSPKVWRTLESTFQIRCSPFYRGMWRFFRSYWSTARCFPRGGFGLGSSREAGADHLFF